MRITGRPFFIALMTLFLSSLFAFTYGQSDRSGSAVQLKWLAPVKLVSLGGDENIFLAFKGAQYNSGKTLLPFLVSDSLIILRSLVSAPLWT